MLKGKSVIELTNVKTGEVERYENPNIITDGVQKYINALFRFGGHSTSTVMWKEIFGGIRLYDNNLEAVASNCYHPSVDVAKLTGYASITQKSSSTTDTMRGDLNTDETKELDNGVQIVYDFATSEANGQIGCCCLTTILGGQRQREIYVDSSTNASFKYTFDNNAYFAIQPKSDILTVLQSTGSGTDYTISFLDYNLENNMTITANSTSGFLARPNRIRTTKFTKAFVDNTMFNSTSFAYVSRANSKTTIQLYKIENGELEQEITLDGTYYGRRLLDDCLIFSSSNYKEYIRVDLANPSNIFYITKNGFGLDKTSSYRIFTTENGDLVLPWAGSGPYRTQTSQAVFFSPKTGNYQVLTISGTSHQGKGFYDNTSVLALCQDEKSIYVGQNENCIMTINNLETPVIKTADKTMKITYTLLESDEATE